MSHVGMLRVPSGSAEPVVQTWSEVSIARLLDSLRVIASGRPTVVAVNGRSGAGKSTLAAQLAQAVPGAAVISTDDVAWNYSMFDWADALVDVVAAVRRGEPVRYRPPGWIAKGRAGAVQVQPDRELLIIEGVGSSQRSMAHVIDASVWVQSDAPTARDFGIERDTASAVNGDRAAATAFWNEWTAAEVPFLEQDAPWLRADAVVAGVRPAGTATGLFWRAS